MDPSNWVLIAAIEVSVVSLLLCGFLFYRNRSLRNLVTLMQGKIEKLLTDVKSGKAKSEYIPGDYADLIEAQIAATRTFHDTLDSDKDIVLDIDPETPFPRRTAALRYALLMTEKEALGAAESEAPDWEAITAKYQQIFTFYEDFDIDTTDEPQNEDELDLLRKELENAKKRISNLEKFKKLYFEMEKQWEESKKNAQSHYNNLSQMASQVEDTDAFNIALEGYSSSYGDFNNLFNKESGGLTQVVEVSDPRAAKEINSLRAITEDQHRIINDLQVKLQAAKTNEQKAAVLENMQEELNKQARFIQESETCIRLMESELDSAHMEIDSLKSQLHALPKLNEQIKALNTRSDQLELKNYALNSANQKLVKLLKNSRKPENTISDGESIKLKKALADMESRYTELEEKYLDLKLQG